MYSTAFDTEEGKTNCRALNSAAHKILAILYLFSKFQNATMKQLNFKQGLNLNRFPSGQVVGVEFLIFWRGFRNLIRLSPFMKQSKWINLKTDTRGLSEVKTSVQSIGTLQHQNILKFYSVLLCTFKLCDFIDWLLNCINISNDLVYSKN